VIKQRLEELGLEQRDLAAAAEVTESYISQLLTRKKLPPAPGRTDIYDKMGKFLKLPSGKLAKLAEHQRKEELKRNLGDPVLRQNSIRTGNRAIRWRESLKRRLGWDPQGAKFSPAGNARTSCAVYIYKGWRNLALWTTLHWCGLSSSIVTMMQPPKSGTRKNEA
jgi:transcriptional regulator with XRE-family HTH domain